MTGSSGSYIDAGFWVGDYGYATYLATGWMLDSHHACLYPQTFTTVSRKQQGPCDNPLNPASITNRIYTLLYP